MHYIRAYRNSTVDPAGSLIWSDAVHHATTAITMIVEIPTGSRNEYADATRSGRTSGLSTYPATCSEEFEQFFTVG
jgi:hypothetical protein